MLKAVIKALKMLGQSTLNFKSRILDCFDFLQKSRNDGVSGIVIAFRFAYYAVIIRQIVDLLNQYKISVIARFGNAESWQSKQTLKIKSARSVNLRPLSVIARALPEATQKIKSFCFVWLLQNEESLYPLDSNPQSKIPLIRSWLIYFSHCFKSRGLDTSLRINATLSMTKFLPYHDKTKRVVILRAIARSIHFGDLRILRNSLTLGESKSNFGLLRRICDSPRNDKLRQSTPHTTHKGIKMQT